MRREELKFSFDQIMTDENDKNRMLNNILKQTEKKVPMHFIILRKQFPRWFWNCYGRRLINLYSLQQNKNGFLRGTMPWK